MSPLGGRRDRLPVTSFVLLMAHHFDIASAALIYDGKLGTLGIVESVLPSDKERCWLPRCASTSMRRPTRAIRCCATEREGRRPALTVELVLLTANETDAEKTALEEIGYAHCIRCCEPRSRCITWASVCWCTRGRRGRSRGGYDGRFPGCCAPRGAGWPPHVRAHNSTLIPMWQLRSTGALELVQLPSAWSTHGPNGSGKSSFVEALELVASGKIERLERAGETNYERVIRSAARWKARSSS